MNPLESYHQAYTYDIGNNLTALSHQAKSNAWQQNIGIHPNNNQGTETKLSATDFDANGNLLTLNNIGTLEWHYNNTLNQLTKDDKTTEYYAYDYQGNRVRTVLESNQQPQSQRNYLPSLDISTDEHKQQANTLHIGTHILSETTKNNTQTRYQLASHLHSTTLELNDKAKIISYEHYYPYGGTAIIAGKTQAQAKQKRYRYTGKERDDSSGLSYYGARYLAPWMARWISPDSAGAVDGLNLYTYVNNNPLNYIDPTGHIPTTTWRSFTNASNTHLSKKNSKLNFWVGEEHDKQFGINLVRSLFNDLNISNFIEEECSGRSSIRIPEKDESVIAREYRNELITIGIFSENLEALLVAERVHNLNLLGAQYNGNYIGGNGWLDPKQDFKDLKLKSSFIALVGSAHLLSGTANIATLRALVPNISEHSLPVYKHVSAKNSIALIPKAIVDSYYGNRNTKHPEYGMWVLGPDGSVENAFLAIGSKKLMHKRFGKGSVQEIPTLLSTLPDPQFKQQEFEYLSPFSKSEIPDLIHNLNQPLQLP